MRCQQCKIRLKHAHFNRCIKKEDGTYKKKVILIGYWCEDCGVFTELDEDY